MNLSRYAPLLPPAWMGGVGGSGKGGKHFRKVFAEAARGGERRSVIFILLEELILLVMGHVILK